MACVTVAAAAAEMERAFSLPPGYRFHPTDQELVNCFLRRKVLGLPMDFSFIPEVDVYRFEPDELPDKSFSPSTDDPGAKVEWYFFTPRCRKYLTGLRVERGTLKGFWKSTGKDHPVMHNGIVVGMKKTLVFHIGRAPSGTRTGWVMHEYRLHPHHSIQDTYALCRVFNKNAMTPSSDLLASEDMDKEGIKLVSVGPNMDNDEMQPMSGAADMNKEGMHPMFVGPGANKDEMQPMSGGVAMDKEGMHSAPNNADMDKEEIQPVFHNANADKEGINLMSGSVVGDIEGFHPVLGSIITDMEGIHPVFSGTVAHNKEIDPMSGGTYTDVDISWMQFVPDDICYPNIELDNDDSCTQLINDYSWQPSPTDKNIIEK